MSVKRVCDKCGKPFDPRMGFTATCDVPVKVSVFPRFSALKNDTLNLDFCPVCWGKFVEWKDSE